MHAQIPENHWQCECSKSDDPGTNAATHYPCIFWNLCVKGAIETNKVDKGTKAVRQTGTETRKQIQTAGEQKTFQHKSPNHKDRDHDSLSVPRQHFKLCNLRFSYNIYILFYLYLNS